MSAKYTRKDKAKTAVKALVVGMLAAAVYVLPPALMWPCLLVWVYFCGVLDGRALRRGGRLLFWLRTVREDVPATLRTMFQRPAGGSS
ncbi:hypothetical protein [Actinomadura hibisca]|uniref:hypothetical protein n=1 Tax=Actinomadura hibisca TaxID=68565 RepID=UPI00082CAC83|nr:hypothetical protein [Actinomadura hibisca]